MKRNEYGLDRQPRPPKAPKEFPVGSEAMPLLGAHAFQTGTVVRVECVPGGAFVTITFGGGVVITLRSRFIRPVPRR